MEWHPIETRPDEGEFLAWDPIASKADVCHATTAEIWDYLDKTATGRPFTTRRGRVDERKSCEAVQQDGEYGPDDDEFQGYRATLWAKIEPPNE
jgi:hypothetical protein